MGYPIETNNTEKSLGPPALFQEVSEGFQIRNISS